MNHAVSFGVSDGEEAAMKWLPLELEDDREAHHRALRRCHGCGAYTRLVGVVDGFPRCERCVEKARRERSEEREIDPTLVDFRV
jgi:tRNA(Ile2) C34 agmatinyltransferase TiaS